MAVVLLLLQCLLVCLPLLLLAVRLPLPVLVCLLRRSLPTLLLPLGAPLRLPLERARAAQGVDQRAVAHACWPVRPVDGLHGMWAVAAAKW